MFVRDLDTSLLGQNANGLEQFETLRQCTDELVNAILHVRQLLKRRRFEGDLFFTSSILMADRTVGLLHFSGLHLLFPPGLCNALELA